MTRPNDNARHREGFAEVGSQILVPVASRLQAALENISDAFLNLDNAGRFAFVNREAERLLQRPRADLLGREWKSEFPEAVDSGFGVGYKKAIAENQAVEVEEYYPPLQTWFSVRAYPNADGLDVFFVDISEKKRVSAMLTEGRQRLALATESARLGIWDWDVVDNRMVWDARMCQLFGISCANCIGGFDMWQQGLHPEDRQRGEEEIAAALAGVKDLNTEFRILWPNGEVHVLEVHGVVERAADGSAAHMIAVNWDISERKRSTRAVERALQRLNEAQRIGLIGDWEYDLATGISWSPQVFKIFGRDPSLGPPQNLTEASGLYDERSAALMQQKVALALESGQIQHYELLALRPNGTQVHLQLIASPNIDEDGTVTGLHGTVQDISARKRDEKALRDRARQQELIATLGRTALTESDLDRVLAAASTAVAEGLNVEFSMVSQLADNDSSFILKAGTGWADGWLGRSISGMVDDNRLMGILASGKRMIVADFATEFPLTISEILLQHKVASGVDLGIFCSDGPWGVLSAYSGEADRFSRDNLDFLQSLANILATAIDRKRKEEQLVHLAHHDPLTDLPNRLLLRCHLEAAMESARRSGAWLAILYLDLDQFKNVNDSFGHGLGDRLLQVVARRLAGALRAPDIVSRQGGDEFVIVLTQIWNEADAARAAERLLRSIDTTVSINGIELLVAGSIGIACFPHGGTDAETLLRNADAALYSAKDAGRNCYRFYAEELNVRARERLALEADLSRAITRAELFLQFQPQVMMSSGKITGVEALVRWRHPTLGIVGPGRFIAVAEDGGFIAAIGNWVLEAACQQQAEWIRAGVGRGRVAVNVSALQFRQKSFVDNVVQTLARTGLEPHRLELELTESSVMQNIESVKEKLIRLNELGVTLAIDDFGTGQSSLTYLKQFPIHRLKIDQSFINGLPDDKEDAAITKAVIGLGQSLGLSVIAEGIESVTQAEYLQSILCDEAQGFYYARPMLPEDWPAFLRRQEM